VIPRGPPSSRTGRGTNGPGIGALFRAQAVRGPRPPGRPRGVVMRGFGWRAKPGGEGGIVAPTRASAAIGPAKAGGEGKRPPRRTCARSTESFRGGQAESREGRGRGILRDHHRKMVGSTGRENRRTRDDAIPNPHPFGERWIDALGRGCPRVQRVETSPRQAAATRGKGTRGRTTPERTGALPGKRPERPDVSGSLRMKDRQAPFVSCRHQKHAPVIEREIDFSMT